MKHARSHVGALKVVCIQAVDALSFLCQEDSLHKMLVEGNVLPALIRQSNMDQPQDFRRNALQAMICICSACMSNPPAGDLSLQTVNNALNSLFESAQAARDDSVVGKQAMEVIGGLASTVAVLKVKLTSTHHQAWPFFSPPSSSYSENGLSQAHFDSP
jgi:hypothetical protein